MFKNSYIVGQSRFSFIQGVREMKKFLGKLFRILLVLGGILFLIFGYYYMVNMKFNLGNLLPILIGLPSIVFGIWGKRMIKSASSGLGRKLRILCATAFLFLVVSFIGMCTAVFFHSKNVPERGKDVVIVLGAGLRGDGVSSTLALRLNKAIEYLIDNDNTIVIVSGGQGPDEQVTEASAMKKYLLDKGIAEGRILEEDQSTSTKENFMFSKTILDEWFGTETYTSIYVTNDFHSFRAGFYAKKIGLNSEGMASASQIYMLPNYYSREYLALLYYFVFER